MINVTISEQPKTETKPFPKLMKHKTNGRINLFFTQRNATVLVNRSDGFPAIIEVGEYGENFNCIEYEDYNEPITLQNA